MRGGGNEKDARERERRSKTEEREITGLANMKIAAVFLYYEERRESYFSKGRDPGVQRSDRRNARFREIEVHIRKFSPRQIF